MTDNFYEEYQGYKIGGVIQLQIDDGKGNLLVCPQPYANWEMALSDAKKFIDMQVSPDETA